MEPLKEWRDWLAAQPVRMICFTAITVALIFGVCGGFAFGCHCMTRADAERAKYRAQEQEAFWKRSEKK